MTRGDAGGRVQDRARRASIGRLRITLEVELDERGVPVLGDRAAG